MQLKHAWCSTSPVLRRVYLSKATVTIAGRAKRQLHTQPSDHDTLEPESQPQEQPQEEAHRQPRELPQEQPNDHSQPQDQLSSQHDDARLHWLTQRYTPVGKCTPVQPRWRFTPDGKSLERRFVFRSFQKATVPAFQFVLCTLQSCH